MDLIKEKTEYIEGINNARYKIADLRETKIDTRARAWKDAEGTAKEKEDYVRSQVSAYDKEIAELEADIEWYYNMIDITNDKMMWIEDE